MCKQVAEFIIKGLCYEDFVAILSANGYATEVHTPRCSGNYNELERLIKVFEVSTED